MDKRILRDYRKRHPIVMKSWGAFTLFVFLASFYAEKGVVLIGVCAFFLSALPLVDERNQPAVYQSLPISKPKLKQTLWILYILIPCCSIFAAMLPGALWGVMMNHVPLARLPHIPVMLYTACLASLFFMLIPINIGERTSAGNLNGWAVCMWIVYYSLSIACFQFFSGRINIGVLSMATGVILAVSWFKADQRLTAGHGKAHSPGAQMRRMKFKGLLSQLYDSPFLSGTIGGLIFILLLGVISVGLPFLFSWVAGSSFDLAEYFGELDHNSVNLLFIYGMNGPAPFLIYFKKRISVFTMLPIPKRALTWMAMKVNIGFALSFFGLLILLGRFMEDSVVFAAKICMFAAISMAMNLYTLRLTLKKHSKKQSGWIVLLTTIVLVGFIIILYSGNLPLIGVGFVIACFGVAVGIRNLNHAFETSEIGQICTSDQRTIWAA